MTPENFVQKKIAEHTQNTEGNYRIPEHCPYCHGKIVKRGMRKKKYEKVQVYYCKNCDKRFTSLITKNKTYPLRLIMDSLIFYNRLNSPESISGLIKEKYGISVTSRTISKWIKEYERYIPFVRMREFLSGKYSQRDLIEESRLIHQQIYNFKYHRGKTDLILNSEFRHFRFKPLQEFLELAVAECPHQLFQNSSKRSSEFKKIFNLNEVKITPKINTAVRIANFVTQAVSNNKLRHQVLQDFMFSNDTVTIATEVAVLLNADDLRHLKHELNFEIPVALGDDEYITGHIDIVQIRNGVIYIMDYKPSAHKEKPIEQLTFYALALSRLTGLRLYHFICAWFDDKNYYEFYPLHVVYKLNKKKKRLPGDQKKLGFMQ